MSGRLRRRNGRPAPIIPNRAFGLLVPLVGVVLLAVVGFGVHKIDEGFVGVYSFGGKIVDGTSQPGYHVMFPYFYSVQSVPVVVQTLNVRNVECGTSSGVMIKFDKVEVVHRLNMRYLVDTVRKYSADYAKIWIEDRIHHEVNQICSRNGLNEIYIEKFADLDDTLKAAMQTLLRTWAPGVEIVAVRVTKPTIPATIQQKYEAIERARSKLRVLEKHENNILKQTEIKAAQSLAKAEKELDVSKIEMQRRIAEAKSQAEIQKIQDKVHIDRMRARTDAHYKSQLQLVESNARKLNPRFLKVLRAKAELDQCQMYLGPRIPRIIIEDEALSSATIASSGRKKH